MCKTWITAVCIGGLAIALPPVVSAQSSEPAPASVRRPFRGIFGAPSGPDSPQSLVFSASLYGAYDDNVIEALTDRRARDPFLQRSGWYQGATAGLTYTVDKSTERFSVGLRSTAQAQYYRRSGDENTAPAYQGDVFFDWHVTRSTTFRARQSAAYSSNYNFSLTPLADEELGHDIAVTDNPDFQIFQLRAVRMTSSVSLTQRLGKNTSLTGLYNFRSVNVIEDELRDGAFRDYGTHAASASTHISLKGVVTCHVVVSPAGMVAASPTPRVTSVPSANSIRTPPSRTTRTSR